MGYFLKFTFPTTSWCLLHFPRKKTLNEFQMYTHASRLPLTVSVESCTPRHVSVPTNSKGSSSVKNPKINLLGSNSTVLRALFRGDVPWLLTQLTCVRLTPPPCRLLPKSARWLMANNQKEEAWKLIQKAAQMNGVSQSKDLEMLRVSLHVPLGPACTPAACGGSSSEIDSKRVHGLCCPSDLQL